MKKKNLFLLVPFLCGLASCTVDINQLVSVAEQVIGSEEVIITDNNSASSNQEVANSETTQDIQSETKSQEGNSEVSQETSIDENTSQEQAQFIDYVSQTKLDLQDDSKIYAEVTVAHYVDGDTTHFIPKGNISNWIEDAVLKARYNSVDTPESTGKIEPWGKAASVYTHDALYNAQSIIIQSDDNKWNTDSTGGRYLVWVWYMPKNESDYRLLNLELIQNGYAKLKSASSYSLYETFSAANYQAMDQSIGLYSNEKAPYYYDGEVQSLSIKELRDNPHDYEGSKVSVEGLITVYDKVNHMAYAEVAADDDDDLENSHPYGINIYLGYSTFTPIKVGNYLRISGNLAFYNPSADEEASDPEADGTWQITGLYYDPYHSSEPESMEIISRNNEVVATPISASILTDFAKSAAIESTFVKLDNLTVTKVYTTQSTKVTSNGALTLTCKDSNNYTVTVRTNVLTKPDGTLLTEVDVLNKTISAQGIVAKFNGKYQLKVFSLDDLQIA